MGLALLAAVALMLEPDFSGPWHLEYAPAHHVFVKWSVARECPEKTVRGWEIYAANPPSLPYQKVDSAELIVDGKKVAKPNVLDLSVAHVPLLGTQLLNSPEAVSNKVETESRYEVTTYSRKLVPGPANGPVEPLLPRDRGVALAANAEFDTHSPVFQEFIDKNDLRIHKDEAVLNFAHRVYRFVRQGMKYKADAPFETTLSEDCKSPWGHCGNYSRRVVGIMRANGIPARMSFGHWIVGGTKTYDEGQYHTRSEIYVDKIGWVLLDTSRGIPDGGWKPEANLDCGFANDEGWFFVFHLHSSLLVPTLTWGPQHQEHMQTTYTPAIGGSWKGSKTTVRLSVEELPLGK